MPLIAMPHYSFDIMPLTEYFVTMLTSFCPRVCLQSQRMTDFMLLRATASGCILYKSIQFKPKGHVNLAIGVNKQLISVTVYHSIVFYSVLAKQKDDRFYAPASYCFWLHPLQIAKLAKMH